MSGLFMGAMIASCVWALCMGKGDALGAGILNAGQKAVTQMLSLCGAYMVWCGLLKILEKSGAVRMLSGCMARPVRRIIGDDARDAAVREQICLNLTANLMGLGNAATPAGLEAMRLMAQCANAARPTHGMCMFLLLNTCSLQLVPTTVLSLRAAYGAAQPGDVLLPTLLCSAVCAATAFLLGWFCRKVGQA